MSIKSRLSKLFGWNQQQVPVQKPKLGDPNSVSDTQSLFDSYYTSIGVPADRKALYSIYDSIDDGMVAAVLDMYAGDASQYSDEYKSKIQIQADSKDIETVIDNLFQRCHIYFDAEAIIRDVAKYGDQFFVLNIDDIPKKDYSPRGPLSNDDEVLQQIAGWSSINPEVVDRLENNEGVLLGFNINQQATGSQTQKEDDEFDYNPWEVMHFRLYRHRFRTVPGGRIRNVYGSSILYPAIKAARRLNIMDDLLMLNRIMRSLDRRIFYIDVGHAHLSDEMQILKKWKMALKRKPWIDPTSDKMTAKFDPVSTLEDMFFPTNKDSANKIETLPGQPDVKAILDVEHFTNNLFGALRAPKGYFGHEDQGGLVPKNTLSAQDSQFGRNCNSLQSSFIDGLTRLVQIELALRNLDPNPNHFTITMVRPSALEEMQRIENLTAKIEAAKSMMDFAQAAEGIDPNAWATYVLRLTLNLSDEDIQALLKQPEAEIDEPDEFEEPLEEPLVPPEDEEGGIPTELL